MVLLKIHVRLNRVVIILLAILCHKNLLNYLKLYIYMVIMFKSKE